MVYLELSDRHGIMHNIDPKLITDIFQIKPHLGTRETMVVLRDQSIVITPNPFFKVKAWIGDVLHVHSSD